MPDIASFFDQARDVVLGAGMAGVVVAGAFVIWTVAIRAVREFTNEQMHSDERSVEEIYHDDYEGPLGEDPSDPDDQRNYPYGFYSEDPDEHENR